MPGIVGAVIGTSAVRPEACLDGMMGALKTRDHFVCSRLQDTDVVLGGVTLDAENGVSAADGVFAGAYGEVVEQDALRALVAESESRTRTLPELLAALYRKRGVGALCGLNGGHSIAVWDSETQTLSVISDRHGLRPLYYWSFDGGFLFASELKALAWHPEFNRTICDQGVADLMTSGYLFEDRTLFRDIKRLEPATVLSYQQGRVTKRQYWDYQFSETEDGISDEEAYIDEYARLLQQAVMRRVGPGMCVPSTGGLDSRTILGMLDKTSASGTAKTVSLGWPQTHDVRFGREIAEAVGLAHECLPIPSSYLRDYADDAMDRVEGMAAFHTSWRVAMDGYLERNEVQTVATGFLGDFIAGGHLTRHFAEDFDTEEEGFRALFDHRYCRVFNDDEQRQCFRKSYYESMRESVWETMQRRVALTPADNFFDKHSYWAMHSRQRREYGVHKEYFSRHCRATEPFTDLDFMDFCFALPLKLRLGQNAYRRMILKHLPKVAKCGYTHTGFPFNASGWSLRMRKAQSRMYYQWLPKLTGGRVGTTRWAVYLDKYEAVRDGSAQYLTNLLSQSAYLEDFFDVDAVRALVAAQQNDVKRDYAKTCALATFILFRKHFCGG
jgi:asparagine synthetase B (glutamine-hydrolysing)